MKGNNPIELLGEIVWRTYTGGREIQRMHGKEEPEDTHFPEEWMFSTTRAANAGREALVEGLCRLAEQADMTLKEYIETNPRELLGEKHVDTWGFTLGVLIKIIDSQERLTIQVHPDNRMAQKLFGSRFGKTECWHILDVRRDGVEPPCIYLGFREGITRQVWEECFWQQDYEKMLSLLNKIEVSPGETYLVKGGIPHAIGSGCFILEIQEPTDYTIRVEKKTPSGFQIADSMCHQGLGYEKMFDCFYYNGYSNSDVLKNFRIESKNIRLEYPVNTCSCGQTHFMRKGMEKDSAEYRELIGYENTPCFKIRLCTIEKECCIEEEDIFCCLYVLEGSGELKAAEKCISFKRNSQVFIPAKSGNYYIDNKGQICIKILLMYGPKC